MLGCSNSVLLLYCTGWLQSGIRMILRVRFVRGFPVSNNISVSKCVSSTVCPGSANNRVSSSVLLYRVAIILYQGDDTVGVWLNGVFSFR